MRLKGYDAWKTRSDLDDADRWRCHDGAPPDRCWFCDRPLPKDPVPWSFWNSDGVNAQICDDCAPTVELEKSA